MCLAVNDEVLKEKYVRWFIHSPPIDGEAY